MTRSRKLRLRPKRNCLPCLLNRHLHFRVSLWAASLHAELVHLESLLSGSYLGTPFISESIWGWWVLVTVTWPFTGQRERQQKQMFTPCLPPFGFKKEIAFAKGQVMFRDGLISFFFPLSSWATQVPLFRFSPGLQVLSPCFCLALGKQKFSAMIMRLALCW